MASNNASNLDEQKLALQTTVGEIRKKLGGKTDFNELPDTLKQELRLLYTEAARISKDIFTAAPKVLEEFNKTEYAARLKATGVITSYICPLMYMNNPLCGPMPVITSSNKLRTYTTARYYTDDEILVQITKGGN